MDVETAKNQSLVHSEASRTKAQEKRKQSRRIVHEKCNVLLTTQQMADGNKNSIKGHAVDISLNGIGLFTNEELSPGTTLVVTVQSRIFKHELIGKVAWCAKLPSLGRIIKAPPALTWRMGLMLLPRNPEETKLLKALADSL